MAVCRRFPPPLKNDSAWARRCSNFSGSRNLCGQPQRELRSLRVHIRNARKNAQLARASGYVVSVCHEVASGQNRRVFMQLV